MGTRPWRMTRAGLSGLVAASLSLVAFSVPHPADASAAPVTPANAVGTLWGAVVKPRNGETYPQAVARSESNYGTLGVIRWFGGNRIPLWSDINARLGTHPSVISFNLLPADVVAGTYDTQLTQWFANMPTNHRIWFSYYHEPDAAVVHGKFTSAQYVAAYKHIAQIARAANKTNLGLTLTLTCFTANPNSHRNWLDYYAGAQVVDVVSWDCYNHGTAPNGYGQPANLFQAAYDKTSAQGEPFAIAEVGSLKRPTDTTGSGRAAWLTAAARYLDPLNPLFVSYFDTNGAGTDYRLLDAPSIKAWHDVVFDQNPNN